MMGFLYENGVLKSLSGYLLEPEMMDPEDQGFNEKDFVGISQSI